MLIRLTLLFRRKAGSKTGVVQTLPVFCFMQNDLTILGGGSTVSRTRQVW
jgi:hypothetical protein